MAFKSQMSNEMDDMLGQLEAQVACLTKQQPLNGDAQFHLNKASAHLDLLRMDLERAYSCLHGRAVGPRERPER